MKSTSARARCSGASNARTCVESVSRKGLSAAAGARVGWAAMSQDGQGVGTDPIWAGGQTRRGDEQGGGRDKGGGTYEAGLAGVDEGFGGEPLPHERARGTVVDGVDQAADVVVHFECGCIINPVSSRVH